MPKKVVLSLKEKGYEVKTPQSGTDDEKVADLSKAEERVLVTFDKHFANTLQFPPENYTGIAFIKIRPPLIKAVFDALMDLFKAVETEQFKGRLYVLSHDGYRVFPKSIPSDKKAT